MKMHFLSSVARFAPPDDLGGGIAEPTGTGTPSNDAPAGGSDGTPAGGTGGQQTPQDDAAPRVESISDSIKRAVSETKQKADAGKKPPATQKSPQTPGAPSGDVSAKPGSDPTVQGNTETVPQGQTGAPQAWKAEEKAIWESLPELARQAINRREADTAKGVQELRTKYQEIEAAVAPYSATLKSNGKSPGQAIDMLFKWNMELAGPNKVAAFKALAQNFGIDPATLAAAQPSGTQPGATPQNPIPDNLRPIIDGLETRMKGFESSAAAQAEQAAKQTWVNWSKDKPHAETVRALMANLISSDVSLMQGGQPQVSNTIKNGSIDMDAAYQAAIYAHPEVRQLVLQEEQKKRDDTARAAAAAARKAGGSLRPGAPAGSMPNGKDPSATRVETPRESIQRALSELRG